MNKTARIIGSITTAALTFTAVAALTWWDHTADSSPLLTGSHTPQLRHVEITDARTTLTCAPAPALASLGEADSESDPESDEPPVGTFDPDYAPDTGDATSTITALTLDLAGQTPAPAELAPLGAKDTPATGEEFELKGSGAVHNHSLPDAQPHAFIATAREASPPPQVAGIRFGRATVGDLRGIAAAACLPTAADQWLVGGQTEAGASAELQLLNPSDTPATVRYEVWGAAGPVSLVGSTSVLVPPGEQRSVLLEGLAPGERRLAVRVQSSGARIGAAIQDVRTLGLTPAGVDYVTPAPAPATIAAIPGLEIKDGDAALLRLLVPGQEPGQVTVRLTTPTGAIAAPDLEGVAVPGEAVSEISLQGIPAGTYTAVIESSVPLTASAELATGAEGTERDIAWLPAAQLDDTSYFALPETDAELAQILNVAGVSDDAVAQIHYLTDAGEIVDAEQLFVAAGESRTARIPQQNSAGERIVGVVVSADHAVAAGITLREVGDGSDGGSHDGAGGGIAAISATTRSTLPSGIDLQYVP